MSDILINLGNRDIVPSLTKQTIQIGFMVRTFPSILETWDQVTEDSTSYRLQINFSGSLVWAGYCDCQGEYLVRSSSKSFKETLKSLHKKIAPYLFR